MCYVGKMNVYDTLTLLNHAVRRHVGYIIISYYVISRICNVYTVGRTYMMSEMVGSIKMKKKK